MAVATNSPSLLSLIPLGNGPLIAGIDEAGRGCLAGPVVAAAVIFAPETDLSALAGLNDSKQCTPAQRERLAPDIKARCLAWGIGVSWPPEIDRLNILNATFHAMARALKRFDRSAPLHLLIDGNKRIPPHLLEKYAPATLVAKLTQEAIVGGDALVPAISAASILAKTFRDRLMTALNARWPGYGFARHKGYGTQEHCQAILRLGPCPQHRLTFRKVRPEPDFPAQGLQASLL